MRKDLLIKLDSLLAVGLAILFFWFFQFTKHDPVISAIMPFGNDPYDAVGSFGVIVAGLLALLAVIRVVRSKPTDQQNILAARTQFTVAATVLVTLIADSVAMVRHPSMWLNHQGTTELLLLMTGIVVLAVGLALLIRFSVRDRTRAMMGPWKRAAIFSIIAIVVLALYPESIIQSTVGELGTLLAGILLLFVPLSALPEAFLPFDNTSSVEAKEQRRRKRSWMQWGAVVLLGICIGGMLLFAESRAEGAPAALPLRILVTSVYIGAAVVGLLIAYACLRKPLDLFRYS